MGSVTEHISEGEGGQEDVTCRLPLFFPAPNQLLSTSHKAASVWGKRTMLDACVAINTEKLLDFYGEIKACTKILFLINAGEAGNIFSTCLVPDLVLMARDGVSGHKRFCSHLFH